MSLLQRLFGNSAPDPKLKLIPLYNQVVAQARLPHWYEEGKVPDTMDGRFDMVATILTLVLLRLESSPENAADMAHLTEIFVDDMDGQLRESGMGDVVVGKHIGKMMGALGGRLGAFRTALADHTQMDGVIMRNIYRTEQTDDATLGYVRAQLLKVSASLAAQAPDILATGEAAW
jgi:cytochrome b pre-mRNA-processing protein 3